jgi:hypothetical protein
VRNGSIVLEAKEDIKKRGYDSPDRADVLAMSFGVKLAHDRKNRKSRSPLAGRALATAVG